MHWHPNADDCLYFIGGQGEVTIFNTEDFDPATSATSSGPTATTSATPERPTSSISRCSAAPFADVWTHTSQALVAQHLNIDTEMVGRFPSDKLLVLPA